MKIVWAGCGGQGAEEGPAPVGEVPVEGGPQQPRAHRQVCPAGVRAG